jgi:DNA polymerase elongation subunit (family B)
VVGKLVERREQLKALTRSTSLEEARRYDSAQKAIKWILVACFGYLGYRNARFGSIEAYECVTALARDVMFKSIRIAERMGFKVLHALIDSLFVQIGQKDRKAIQKLIRNMEKRLGYGLKVEADYTWIAFFSDVSRISGVPSRYLGRLREGGIKVKGLELCRRDAPPLIKRTMGECLSMLSQTTSEAELKEALTEALRLIKKREIELYSGLVKENELVIERRISKPVEKYCKRVSHVLAAKRLTSVSESVRYIESQIPYPVDLGFMGYSADKYSSWLRRAAEPLRQMLDIILRKDELHGKSRLTAE